tara:strand:+ start:1239 stop:1721 length:483 start_codon:yes stop_codon:yes gene_type:complete
MAGFLHYYLCKFRNNYGKIMKKKYPEILTITANNQKIKITKTSSYFVVKIGKEDWDDIYYQKKADSAKCYDLESLKNHLKQICSLNSIDYDSVENHLNKALKPSAQVNVPNLDDSMVVYGGISKYFDYIIEQKLAGTEQSEFYGIDIKKYKSEQNIRLAT